MKIESYKILASVLFLSVFFVKMNISVAPLFSFLDDKTVHAVIMQLEQETKTEKDDPDKDVFKEKKVFEPHLMAFFDFRPILLETNILHNSENSLYIQTYHPVVPTPPPNA